MQMVELREENLSLMKQLDTVRDASRVDIGKVDKNANLQMTSVSDEPLAADTQQLDSSEADKEQVAVLSCLSECENVKCHICVICFRASDLWLLLRFMIHDYVCVKNFLFFFFLLFSIIFSLL